jgi:hypothetical protein
MTTAMAANPNNNDPINARNGMNLLVLLANAHATTLTVFMRQGFGSEALGISGICAALMILLYAGFSNSPEMITYLWVWVAAVAYQRIYGIKQRQKGQVVHSRYAGWPQAAMRFTKSEKIAREVVEPLICVAAGAAMYTWSEPVGRFILAGPVSLLITRVIEMQITKNRLSAMQDAAIEQRYLADLFSHRRNDI